MRSPYIFHKTQAILHHNQDMHRTNDICDRDLRFIEWNLVLQKFLEDRRRSVRFIGVISRFGVRERGIREAVPALAENKDFHHTQRLLGVYNTRGDNWIAFVVFQGRQNKEVIYHYQDYDKDLLFLECLDFEEEVVRAFGNQTRVSYLGSGSVMPNGSVASGFGRLAALINMTILAQQSDRQFSNFRHNAIGVERELVGATMNMSWKLRELLNVAHAINAKIEYLDDTYEFDNTHNAYTAYNNLAYRYQDLDLLHIGSALIQGRGDDVRFIGAISRITKENGRIVSAVQILTENKDLHPTQKLLGIYRTLNDNWITFIVLQDRKSKEVLYFYNGLFASEHRKFEQDIVRVFGDEVRLQCMNREKKRYCREYEATSQIIYALQEMLILADMCSPNKGKFPTEFYRPAHDAETYRGEMIQARAEIALLYIQHLHDVTIRRLQNERQIEVLIGNANGLRADAFKLAIAITSTAMCIMQRQYHWYLSRSPTLQYQDKKYIELYKEICLTEAYEETVAILEYAAFKQIKSVIQPQLIIPQDMYAISYLKKLYSSGSQNPEHGFLFMQNATTLHYIDLWITAGECIIQHDSLEYHDVTSLRRMATELMWGHSDAIHTNKEVCGKTWLISKDQAAKLFAMVEYDIKNPPEYFMSGDASIFRFAIPTLKYLVANGADIAKSVSSAITLYALFKHGFIVYDVKTEVDNVLTNNPMLNRALWPTFTQHNCATYVVEKLRSLQIAEINDDLTPMWLDKLAYITSYHLGDSQEQRLFNSHCGHVANEYVSNGMPNLTGYKFSRPTYEQYKHRCNVNCISQSRPAQQLEWGWLLEPTWLDYIKNSIGASSIEK